MTMKSICPRAALALLAAAALLSACGRNPGVGGAAGDATPATVAANEAVAKSLALDDPKDFEDAKRGLIARPEGKILAADGSTVLIDFDAYKFVEGKAPPTVNPSLWRQAQLNAINGLFKVTERVYARYGPEYQRRAAERTQCGLRERRHLGDRHLGAIAGRDAGGTHAAGACADDEQVEVELAHGVSFPQSARSRSSTTMPSGPAMMAPSAMPRKRPFSTTPGTYFRASSSSRPVSIACTNSPYTITCK